MLPLWPDITSLTESKLSAVVVPGGYLALLLSKNTITLIVTCVRRVPERRCLPIGCTKISLTAHHSLCQAAYGRRPRHARRWGWEVSASHPGWTNLKSSQIREKTPPLPRQIFKRTHATFQIGKKTKINILQTIKKTQGERGRGVGLFQPSVCVKYRRFYGGTSSTFH